MYNLHIKQISVLTMLPQNRPFSPTLKSPQEVISPKWQQKLLSLPASLPYNTSHKPLK
jgi:hypothetical protein